MQVMRKQVAGAIALIPMLVACAADGGPTPSPVSGSTRGPVTAMPSVVVSTPTPVAVATPAPTPVPSAAGPVVLASKQYPYKLTVPAGPVSFIGAPAPWDGVQHLSTDARMADRARVPGSGLLFLAMTDTTKAIDAYADEMEAKFRSWHGCAPTSQRRAFSAGDLKGIGFSQSCANGSHFWHRALLVGKGRALVAMSDGGTLDTLINVLSGIEFVEP